MSNRSTQQAWAVGGTVFAATAIMIIGLFQVIMGISALAQDEIFVNGTNYTYDIDVTGWGWIHLILGVLMIVTGVFLYTAAPWARALGIVMAVLSAVDNFFFLPYYPLWSMVVIALDIFVIWSLATVITPMPSGPPPQSAAPSAAQPSGRTQSQDWSHVNEPTPPRATDQPGPSQEHTAER